MRVTISLALLGLCLSPGCYRSHGREVDGGEASREGGLYDAPSSSDAASLDARAPAPIDSLPGPLAQVCLGDAHLCALSDLGLVHCVGSNENGQLGDGTLVSRSETAAVVDLPPAVQIECSRRYNTCIVSDTGSVYCWGANREGAGGASLSNATSMVLGPAVSRPALMDRLERTERVTMARYHTCALRGGVADCWGFREDEPFLMRGIEMGDVAQATGHIPGTCILEHDGTARFQDGVWRRFESWVLGEGVIDLACSPGLATSPDRPRFDACISHEPGRYACGRARDDGAFNAEPRYDGFVQLAIGQLWACGLRADGSVECNGGDRPRDLPDWPFEPVSLPRPAMWIGAGVAYACAVTDDGQLWCWGAIDPLGPPIPPTPILFP